MKLKDVYELFIQEGIKADPRTKSQISKFLLEKKKEYQKLKAPLKQFFDKEVFKNPYSDTRILFGDPNRDIKRIMVGIDIDVSDLMLADYLSQRTEPIDLVFAHHPKGIAMAMLADVMSLQADMLHNLGFEERIADKLIKARSAKVARGVHGANHMRVVDAAKLLNIPLMCCHTPSDNYVTTYLQKLMDKEKPKTLNDILRLLLKEPEYRDAAYLNAGPKILIGKDKDKAGRTFVDMTGGTEGSENIFGRLSQVGIKTQISMHLSDTHFGKLEAEHINLIVAGHIASDNLGINLLLDRLERKGKFEIVCCSGFRRFKR